MITSQRKHNYQTTISVYIQATSYIYLQNLCLAKQPKVYSINTGTELQVSLTPPLLFLHWIHSCKPWQTPICVVCVLIHCGTPSPSLAVIHFAWNVSRCTGTNWTTWASIIAQSVGQPLLLVPSCAATYLVLVLMNVTHP